MSEPEFRWETDPTGRWAWCRFSATSQLFYSLITRHRIRGSVEMTVPQSYWVFCKFSAFHPDSELDAQPYTHRKHSGCQCLCIWDDGDKVSRPINHTGVNNAPAFSGLQLAPWCPVAYYLDGLLDKNEQLSLTFQMELK